jgi:hypothetical protein
MNNVKTITQLSIAKDFIGDARRSLGAVVENCADPDTKNLLKNLTASLGEICCEIDDVVRGISQVEEDREES